MLDDPKDVDLLKSGGIDSCDIDFPARDPASKDNDISMLLSFLGVKDREDATDVVDPSAPNPVGPHKIRGPRSFFTPEDEYMGRRGSEGCGTDWYGNPRMHRGSMDYSNYSSFDGYTSYDQPFGNDPNFFAPTADLFTGPLAPNAHSNYYSNNPNHTDAAVQEPIEPWQLPSNLPSAQDYRRHSDHKGATEWAKTQPHVVEKSLNDAGQSWGELAWQADEARQSSTAQRRGHWDQDELIYDDMDYYYQEPYYDNTMMSRRYEVPMYGGRPRSHMSSWEHSSWHEKGWREGMHSADYRGPYTGFKGKGDMSTRARHHYEGPNYRRGTAGKGYRAAEMYDDWNGAGDMQGPDRFHKRWTAKPWVDGDVGKMKSEVVTLEDLHLAVNASHFEVPGRSKFFVIKSFNMTDVKQALKHSVWASTEHGNQRLQAAYETGATVFLFFSVNGSGFFCGMAKMISNVDKSKKSGLWSDDRWGGSFRIQWLYLKDIPNKKVHHLRVGSKSVTRSRDAQEMLYDQGKQMVQAFVDHHGKSTLLEPEQETTGGMAEGMSYQNVQN